VGCTETVQQGKVIVADGNNCQNVLIDKILGPSSTTQLSKRQAENATLSIITSVMADKQNRDNHMTWKREERRRKKMMGGRKTRKSARSTVNDVRNICFAQSFRD